MSISSSSSGESGMSLIELLVVIVVSGIVLSVVAAVFVNGWTAQQQASARNAATAELNAITADVTESVRNATVTRVSAGGTRLDAKVLGADGATWQCRAWHLDAGRLRYSSGTSARSASSAAWTAIASDVRGTFTAGAAFSSSGTRVSIGLRMTRGDVSVTITSGAAAQVVQAGGPSCW
ncbi:type II secretion system protein [Microbacterium sp. TNHR37B]|uniref:type II secretion system protein n=1 Tax=Microbacterium sp. TNHR37B TaxID=1775956 RepID=UPI0022B22517|nr:prepilin-type N-terminal cleavage/methylation domain-containing protein [Microbacterium sp. TNHR37B]